LEKNILDINSLSVKYEKNEALKSVSFGVPYGIIFALIGANGAGKSTVAKVISGLKKPDSGEILFKEKRIDTLPPHEIAKLGIAHVPEGRRLFMKMSVRENLIISIRDKKKSPMILERVFSHFPILKDRIKQKAGTLSGGEQQMLAIGRALMTDPILIILDEPSLGLSPVMTTEIANIIAEINRQGTTVILAEQNAHLALTLSQKVLVLETGHIALIGNTSDLIHNEDIIKAYLSA
jgi:branched-chain amino acid transport system ATP-binding protein